MEPFQGGSEEFLRVVEQVKTLVEVNPKNASILNGLVHIKHVLEDLVDKKHGKEDQGQVLKFDVDRTINIVVVTLTTSRTIPNIVKEGKK